MSLRKLEIKEKQLVEKQEALMQWLLKNWNNPERMKIISDRNNNSVELHTVRFQIEQIKKGEPLLGLDLGLDVSHIVQEKGKKTNVQY